MAAKKKTKKKKTDLIEAVRAHVARTKTKVRPFPPPTEKEIKAAEKILGRPLPATLERVYAEIGNGGFGPGYGLRGLVGGFTDPADNDASATKMYTRWSKAPEWPKGLLPIMHWGCGIYSCVDVTKKDAPVVRFWGDRVVDLFDDRGKLLDRAAYDACFAPESPSFEQWLLDWLSGKSQFTMR